MNPLYRFWYTVLQMIPFLAPISSKLFQFIEKAFVFSSSIYWKGFRFQLLIYLQFPNHYLSLPYSPVFIISQPLSISWSPLSKSSWLTISKSWSFYFNVNNFSFVIMVNSTTFRRVIKREPRTVSHGWIVLFN